MSAVLALHLLMICVAVAFVVGVAYHVICARVSYRHAECAFHAAAALLVYLTVRLAPVAPYLAAASAPFLCALAIARGLNVARWLAGRRVVMLPGDRSDAPIDRAKGWIVSKFRRRAPSVTEKT